MRTLIKDGWRKFLLLKLPTTVVAILIFLEALAFALEEVRPNRHDLDRLAIVADHSNGAITSTIIVFGDSVTQDVFKTFRIGGNELYEKILFTINHLQDYEKLNSILLSNQYFQPEKLRELAIIKGLYDGFSTNEFSSKVVISMLTEIIKNSKWKKHQQITQNCINELLKYKIGERCPEFHLINQKGEYLNTKKCENHFTYINFFATWNHKSLQEMEIINEMSLKYNFINFISVNMDQKDVNYKNYIKEKNHFDWHICKPVNREEIINTFDIDHLPTHILIDPKGSIAQYPAYPPTPLYNNQSIDVTFFNIQKNNTTKSTFGIGGKN